MQDIFKERRFENPNKGYCINCGKEIKPEEEINVDGRFCSDKCYESYFKC